jgi:hypothetical protein
MKASNHRLNFGLGTQKGGHLVDRGGGGRIIIFENKGKVVSA